MERLIVSQGKWNAQAAIWLDSALVDDPDFSINDLAYSVHTGESALFHILDDAGEQIGNFVLRKEGPEMVMVAVGGYLKGASITQLFTPYIEEVARAHGCRTMRSHTRQKGVEKLMSRAGWMPSEVIYRREVQDGR